MVRWPSDILLHRHHLLLHRHHILLHRHYILLHRHHILLHRHDILLHKHHILLHRHHILLHRHQILLRRRHMLLYHTYLAGLGGPGLRAPPPERGKRSFWALGSSGKQIADCKPGRRQDWKSAGTQTWQTTDCHDCTVLFAAWWPQGGRRISAAPLGPLCSNVGPKGDFCMVLGYG